MERYRSTRNRHGYMHSLTSVAKMFIDYSRAARLPVLDIGAAYGVASIPALEVGAAVVSNDISQELLDELERRAPEDARDRLTLVCGRFPGEVDFDAGSFEAILISHVLPFLLPDEVGPAVSKIRDWLAPGGKLFVLSYSVYNGALKNFASQYERNAAAGVEWPGYIEDARANSAQPEITDNLPRQINCLHPEHMNRLFEDAGFTVELSEFAQIEGDDADPRFKQLSFDGREWVRFVARK